MHWRYICSAIIVYSCVINTLNNQYCNMKNTINQIIQGKPDHDCKSRWESAFDNYPLATRPIYMKQNDNADTADSKQKHSFFWRMPRSSFREYTWWQRCFRMADSPYSSKLSTTILWSLDPSGIRCGHEIVYTGKELEHPAPNIRKKASMQCYTGQTSSTVSLRQTDKGQLAS